MDAKFGAVALAFALGFAVSDTTAQCFKGAQKAAEPLMQQITNEQPQAQRVIVKVSETAGRNTDETASAEELFDRNKAELVELMRDNGAITIEPIVGQPLVVMEVTPQGLQYLLDSPLVEAVQEDRPEMPR